MKLLDSLKSLVKSYCEHNDYVRDHIVIITIMLAESIVILFNKGKEVYYLYESVSLFDSLPLTDTQKNS